MILVSVLAFGLTACGSDGDGGGGGDDGVDASGGGGGSDGGGGGGDWQALVAGDWELPAGSEGYICVRVTVPEDMYVSEFRAINPSGTHHTVLAIETNGGGTDGTFDCNANTLGDAAIFGSGVGTNPVAFPEGIAVKLTAGQKLLLNLHLFNIADSPLSGRSGTEIKTIPATQVEHEAEIVLMGKTANLTVPVGESTQTGGCVMNGDVTLFAVNPHMHQLGTHMKVIAHSSVDGDVVLHDAPYNFEQQSIYPIAPFVEMKQGDEVEVQCSYNNNTGSTVSFGDSSLEEMCFGTMYRYPPRGGQFGVVCDSDFPSF